MCGFVWVYLSCFVYTSAEVMYSVHILVHKQYTTFGSIMMKFVIHGLPVDLHEGTENPGNHQRLEGSSLRTFLTVHHVGNVHMPTFWNGGWKVPRYWKKWPSAGALNQKPIRLSLKSAEINMRTKILRLYFRQYYYKSSIKTSVVSVAATLKLSYESRHGIQTFMSKNSSQFWGSEHGSDPHHQYPHSLMLQS